MQLPSPEGMLWSNCSLPTNKCLPKRRVLYWRLVTSRWVRASARNTKRQRARQTREANMYGNTSQGVAQGSKGWWQADNSMTQSDQPEACLPQAPPQRGCPATGRPVVDVVPPT